MSLRFAMIGAGFWAPFQLAAWKELGGTACAAVLDTNRAKAEAVAQRFGIPSVYSDGNELLRKEQLDFDDVVSDNSTHSHYVHLAAAHRVPVICQKPMAAALVEAEKMVEACRQAGVPFFIHENYRWQAPIRALKETLESGAIGMPFRARIDGISSFPDLKNQPFLAELEQYILADMGTHLLDVARFLFGEAETIYCQTRRVHPNIKGEDVATVVMKMGGETTVLCELALAENPLEHDCFPQSLFFIEGERGSIEVAPNYWLRVTTETGTHARRRPATPGPIRTTTSCMPAWSLALAICWEPCKADARPKPPLRTILSPCDSSLPLTTRHGAGSWFGCELWPDFMEPYDNHVMGKVAPETWDPVRQSLGQTRRLAGRVDLAAMVPREDLASTKYCLAQPGVAYIVYLPDGGEVTVDLAASDHLGDTERGGAAAAWQSLTPINVPSPIHQPEAEPL